MESTMLSDKILMGSLLVTGLIVAAGLAFQLTTGMRMRRAGSMPRRKAHKAVGYALIAISVIHLPLGVLDVVQVFFK
jgi:hypothetical protein